MQPHSHNQVGPDQTRHSQQSQHHHPYQARPASSSSAVGSTSSASRPRTANSVSPNNTSSDRPPKPPRKLNRSANQLHRNQACLPCRRRRIKCDAAKPHCSSCIRSFRFLARTQPDPEREARGVQCVYEESTDNEPVGGGGAEGASQPSLHIDPDHPRNTVLKLEGRIAELQDALARLSDGQQALGVSMSTPNSATFPVHSSPHQHPLSAGAAGAGGHSVPRSMSWSTVDSNVAAGGGAGTGVGGGSAFSPQQYSPAPGPINPRFSFEGAGGAGMSPALGPSIISSTPLSSSPIQEHSTASHRFMPPGQTGVSHHHSLSGHSGVMDMGIGGMGHMHHSLQGSRGTANVLSDCGYQTGGIQNPALPAYQQDLGTDEDGSRGASSAGGGQYIDVFRQGWTPYLAEPSLIDHFVQTFIVAPSGQPPTPTQETLLNLAFPPTLLRSTSPKAQLAPTLAPTPTALSS